MSKTPEEKKLLINIINTDNEPNIIEIIMSRTPEQQDVAKLMQYFKTVGLHFAKAMKQMLDNGEIKPPAKYTVEEYKDLIDTAHFEASMNSASNTNKKNKKLQDEQSSD